MKVYLDDLKMYQKIVLFLRNKLYKIMFIIYVLKMFSQRDLVNNGLKR